MVCESHRTAPAARQCTRCQRLWCALCVKQLTIGGKLLEVCVKCGGRLQEPTVLPAPPDYDLAELLRRPFSADGLITAAAIALPGALRFIPGFGGLLQLIYYAAVAAYYFQIIGYVGSGGQGLPGPSDAGDTQGALFFTALRGQLCIAVGLAPFLLWHYLAHDAGGAPIALATLVAGMTYLPAVLIAVVLTDSTLGALYPVAWVQIIARAPRSYALLVGIFALSIVAFFGITLLAAAAAGFIPILGAWLVATVANLMLFAQAALVGGFLRRHAQDFGYA
ncbi:MAG TPA: hypothetical protein VGL86_00775 [Polyangia bacterium]|jgi:hypothetical protein